MKTLITIVVTSLILMTPVSKAANCDLVYDEFDSLMNKQFLLSPAKYVNTVKNRLSRSAYNNRQKGKFLLNASRKGLGVAIVHTNRNTRGKLLFTWSSGGKILIIKESILYGRVLDGFNPRVRRNIRIRSSFQYDLDNGQAGGAGADIWFHNIDGKRMYIEAVNGARLEFPMQSLCTANKGNTVTLAGAQTGIALAELDLSKVGVLASAQDLNSAQTELGVNSGSAREVKRELLANGHVLVTYSDGSKIELHQGGVTLYSPDGNTGSAVLMDTQMPIAFPVEPPSANESNWLESHRQSLSNIILSMVSDEALVNQAINAVDTSNNLYESIATRSMLIQNLITPE